MRHLRGIVVLSAAHFVVAMAIAVVAFGTDMDQLRSRTPWSRAAAAVHDVLWLPHDAALRAIPHPWFLRNLWVTPLALVLNSLLAGAVLYALVRAWRGRRQRSLHSTHPAPVRDQE